MLQFIFCFQTIMWCACLLLLYTNANSESSVRQFNIELSLIEEYNNNNNNNNNYYYYYYYYYNNNFTCVLWSHPVISIQFYKTDFSQSELALLRACFPIQVGVKGTPKGYNRGLDCDVLVAEVCLIFCTSVFLWIRSITMQVT